MPDVLERARTRPIAVESKVLDARQGIVALWPTISCNLDADADVVLPGATKFGLGILKPKGVWHHDWKTPVAKALDVVEYMPGDKALPQRLLDKGLGGTRIEAQFNLKTQAGSDAFDNIEFFGDEQEYSVGYEIVDGQPAIRALDKALSVLSQLGIDNAKTLALIKDAGDVARAQFIFKWLVAEFSPVLFGSNGEGFTESVKSDDDRVARLERAVVKLLHGKGLDVPNAVDEKVGRTISRRNAQELRRARDAITNLLDQAADDDDEGKDKAYVQLRGSDDEERNAVAAAVQEAWNENRDTDSRIWVYVEAMFDGYCVVSVEDYDGDPADYWQVPYEINDEGEAVLGPAQPVILSVVQEATTVEADDPLPATGVVDGAVETGVVAPDGPVPLLPPEAATPKALKDKHPFQPRSSNRYRCEECGQGRNRPWHTTAAASDDEDKDRRPVSQKDLVVMMLEHNRRRTLA